MASYLLKAPDEQMGRWRDAASRMGQSLADFLRDAADAADLESAAPARPKAKPRKGERQARTTMCEHRVPPDRYCKRGCDG